MARKIKTFPDHLSPTGRAEEYPWDKWLDGDVWEFTMKDFPGIANLDNVRATFYPAAKRRGRQDRIVKLRTSIQGDKLYIQAILRTNGKTNDEM
jgi:hypothetical protein